MREEPAEERHELGSSTSILIGFQISVSNTSNSEHATHAMYQAVMLNTNYIISDNPSYNSKGRLLLLSPFHK